MIPVNEPLLAGRELEYLTDCIRSGWISSAGSYLDRFEQGWADYCGAKYGVAVSNGTAALYASVASLRLQPGDEVILPSFTIISCAQAVTSAAGVPVVVDCDPQTWCMDTEAVASRITERTRAIMPVHIYGHPVDMDAIVDLARRHALVVIEDAAEAHGAQYLCGHGGNNAQWRRCGSLGDVSTFSFYANKLLTTGEGGMVLCDDAETAEFLRRHRNLGFAPPRRFEHNELGHNYRMTNMQAALGLAQLERIDEIVAKKRWMGNAYNEGLADVVGLQLPVECEWARQVYWMYAVVLSDEHGIDAVRFAELMLERGVQTRPFFLGMHEQPVFRRSGLFHGERYPTTERIARMGVYLPSGMTLTEAQVSAVCEAVQAVLG